MPHVKKVEDKKLIELYSLGYSCETIAKSFSMSRQAVWERIKRIGIETRKKKVLGFIMYNGIKFTPSGYGYWRSTKRDKNLFLHRYKYEREIGKIPKGFDVHHIDGNRSNNNIKNLVAIEKAEHTRLHQMEKKCKK